MDESDLFADQTSALEQSLADAAITSAKFKAEMESVNRSVEGATLQLGRLEAGFSGGLRRAFDGLVFDGMKLSDALGAVAQAMIDTTYSAAIKPVANHFGSLLADGVNGLVAGVLPFQDGAPFSQGRVMPFARGGIISQATAFPMRGGTGLMGEAGPEAIMPLARGADGRLGVRAAGGGSTHVTMNITTPDVAGFERSRGQIAAQMTRALGHGNRNR